MAVTAQMVKELREMTGAGMMDCKKALVETDGDMDKAIELLREKGPGKGCQEGRKDSCNGSREDCFCAGRQGGRHHRGKL